MLNNKSVLITGGTGSFGKLFVKTVLNRYDVKRLVIFSRDELKQFDMSNEPEFSTPLAKEKLRFFIGNVREKDRLLRAFKGVDVVVHAAALKQISACEYNPSEAIKTNVIGGQNVVNAAIDRDVETVLAMSTDKACNPINLYGASKLCSEKLFIAGNSYSGAGGTRFAVVRYGNVVGSRGSVIPFFLKLRETGRLTITDMRMTRFWITLQQGVNFVLTSLKRMIGGELFVPKIPSMKMVDLARTIGPNCELVEIGIRPGEKLHELMISEDDARLTIEFDDYYLIQPPFSWWTSKKPAARAHLRAVAPNFRYSSDNNVDWLSEEQLLDIIQPFMKKSQ
jgi:UDP-N-acetylglucosamine 4,6-dehydratase/5-epimerase